MKKVFTILIILSGLSFIPKAKASHIYGAEIRWECVDSGKFVFHLDVYVNCYVGSASWNYQSESLRVLGSPLPQNDNNNPISLIAMQPDSNKWINHNNGELAPDCNPNSPNQLSCGDIGATRVYFYKSNPIKFNGTPPSSGWFFVYDPPCCRPDAENLQNSSSVSNDFRALMYPPTINSNGDSCMYSTPKFVELPTNTFCRESEYSYSHAAKVKESIDSIVYEWDRSYNTFPTQPTIYDSAYNYDKVTPDTSFDARNKVASIDRQSGMIDLAVYNGNGAQSYLVVVRADAYKDGEVASSIFREIPFIFFDCPPIDSVTTNTKPIFYFDYQQRANYEIVVEAGDKLELPIQVFDPNNANSSITMQGLTLLSLGSQFAEDYSDTTNCTNPPCAVLKDSVPQFDSSRMHYEINADSILYTKLEWQTNCQHLNADGTSKTYYFYFSAKDDYCPIPQQVDTYVKVTVGAEGVLESPQINCIIERSSANEISWSAGQGLLNNFTKWYVFAGDSAHQLHLIDSIATFNTQTYLDTAAFDYYQIKTYTSCGSSKAVLQSKILNSNNIKEFFINTVSYNNHQLIANDSLADSYQWYDCLAGTIIPSSTNRTFTPTAVGTYAAILTKGLCVDTTNCLTISTVGLNENSFQNSINFYPNPSSGFVNIEFSQNQQSLQVKVRNIHGQLVQVEQFVNQGNLQLQLKGKPGIYFIELVNEKEERANVKMVKR